MKMIRTDKRFFAKPILDNPALYIRMKKIDEYMGGSIHNKLHSAIATPFATRVWVALCDDLYELGWELNTGSYDPPKLELK